MLRVFVLCLHLVQDVNEAHAGDIVMVAGLPDIGIGDTIVDPANPNVRGASMHMSHSRRFACVDVLCLRPL